MNREEAGATLFEQRESLKTIGLQKVHFERIQAYTLNEKTAGMDVILKPYQERSNLQLCVTIPKGLCDYYKMVICANAVFLLPKLDVMDEYQQAVGVYIRHAIICLNSSGEQEAWLFITSEYAKSSYYKVPDHMAILYCMVRNLPILVEERLLETQSNMSSLADVHRHMEAEVQKKLKRAYVLFLLIEQEEMNSTFLSQLTDEEICKSINTHDLRILKQQMEEMEKYEWAKRFSDLIDLQERDE